MSSISQNFSLPSMTMASPVGSPAKKKRDINCKEIIKQKVSFKGVFYSVRAAGPTGVIWFALGRPTRDPKCSFRGLFTVAPAAEHKTGGGSIEPDSSVASIIMAFTESCARAVAVASCDRVCLALSGATEETLACVSWSGQAEGQKAKVPSWSTSWLQRW